MTIKTSKSQVTYIDHMGTDKSVVNSARVSFLKNDEVSLDKEFMDLNRTDLTEQDKRLIQYLATHDHWSPFAHNSIQLKITAPIFIARQLVKHQVGGVWNEVSRRYVSSDVVYFANEPWRGKPINAKQGSSGVLEHQTELNKLLLEHYAACEDLYRKYLEAGVCPEQARMVLPLASMTDWYWTGSLMFWARVCKQRLDSHAQSEARDVAVGIADECSALFPVSWAALMK